MLSGLVSSGITGPTRSRHNVGPLWISAKNKQPFVVEGVVAATFPKNHALTVDGSVFLGSPSSGAGRLSFYQSNQYAPVSTLLGTNDINNNQNLRCNGNFLTTNLYVSYGSNDCRMSAIGNGADFVNLGSNMGIRWDSVTQANCGVLGNNADLVILRDAAGVFAQRNGVNAQTFRLYNTYTSATSNEFLQIRGVASANFEIGPQNGSAGGTLRGLTIGGYALGSATITGWLQFRPNATTAALEAFYLGPIADSTAVGGNARGANAVDLQTLRSAASQVGSGLYSFTVGSLNTNSGPDGCTVIGYNSTCTSSQGQGSVVIGYQSNITSGYGGIAIGYRNNVSGAYSQGNTAIGNISNASATFGTTGVTCTAIGDNCTASAVSTLATGEQSSTSRVGMRAHASGRFAAQGDAQYVRFVARVKTTNNTATTLLLDSGTTKLTIPSGKIMFADILISGIKSDGSAAATYKRKVAIKNVGGTTSLVGTVETIGTDYEDNASTDVAITADDTNDALQINVTGIAAETWRWVAVVEGLEIAYGI